MGFLLVVTVKKISLDAIRASYCFKILICGEIMIYEANITSNTIYHTSNFLKAVFHKL